MEEITIKSFVTVCKIEELNEKEQHLVSSAIKATDSSYAPYSSFSVGCAVLLDNGIEIIGCNQENAAFSVTICAERTALFSAGAQYPAVPVACIAIAAKSHGQLLDSPVTPCGSCRQALIETEQRFKRQVRILLYGTRHIYAINGIGNLMPLSFTEEQM